ncbi:MAG: amidohydrolase, partial [Pseudomonadota bacterium]
MAEDASEGQIVIEADWLLEGFDGDRPIIHEGAGLLVSSGLVAQIAPQEDLRRSHPDVPRAGGRGQALIPGLIDAHHHVGATPVQLGSPDLPLELWFASRIALRDVDPYLDTLQSAFELI